MFADRQDAGRRLAERLARDGGEPREGHAWAGGIASDRSLGPLVVGLPRGGVVVAAAVADQLDLPLDVLVVRKLGCPWQPELGIGAIAEGDIRVLNDSLVRELGLTVAEVDAVTATEQAELGRRVARYRHGRERATVRGREIIVVDDGLATGYTARAAIASLRAAGARRVILAVPVSPDSSAAGLRGVADEVFVADTAPFSFAVGASYADFRQTSDDEVVALLHAGAAPAQRSDPG